MTIPVPAPCWGSGWKNSFWLKPWVRTFTTPGSTLASTLWTSLVTSLLPLGPKLVTLRVVVLPPNAATSPPATSAPTKAPRRAAHSQGRAGGGEAMGGAGTASSCPADGSSPGMGVERVSSTAGSQLGYSSLTGTCSLIGHAACSSPRLPHPWR